MNNTKGIAAIPIVVIIVAVLALGVTGYFFYSMTKNTNESADTNMRLVNVNTNSTVVINGNVNENANANSNINGNLNTNVAVVSNSNANVNVITNANGNVNVTLNANTNSNVNASMDPTKDWKTYTNSTIGYTVKYPNTWKVYTCPDVTAVWFGTTPIPCQSEGPGNDFVIDRMSVGFNLTTTINETKSIMVDPKQTTVTVGGVSGTRLTGTAKKDSESMTGGGEYKDDVFVQHNGRYYHFGYFILSGEVKYATEFKNFLASFTFTK
ncbi:MAG: hypothetical protein V1907_03155 [Candidatus Kerfeldbacteria bacterium]